MEELHQYNKNFVEKMKEYVTIKDPKEGCVCIEPAPFDKLWPLKKIDDQFFVTTGTAKVTIADSKRIFEAFGSKVIECLNQNSGNTKIDEAKKTGNPQKLQVYKPKVSSS